MAVILGQTRFLPSLLSFWPKRVISVQAEKLKLCWHSHYQKALTIMTDKTGLPSNWHPLCTPLIWMAILLRQSSVLLPMTPLLVIIHDVASSIWAATGQPLSVCSILWAEDTTNQYIYIHNHHIKYIESYTGTRIERIQVSSVSKTLIAEKEYRRCNVNLTFMLLKILRKLQPSLSPPVPE